MPQKRQPFSRGYIIFVGVRPICGHTPMGVDRLGNSNSIGCSHYLLKWNTGKNGRDDIIQK